MVFSSFVFVCLFLPAVFLLERIMPSIRTKNTLLTIASVLFYAYGEPIFVFVLIAVVAFHWLAGTASRRIGRFPKALLAVLLTADVLLLFVFKYSGFAATAVNGIFGLSLVVPQISLPIGVSFFTFQIMSYAIDAYRDNDKIQTNFFDLLLYISFFPQLIAGPIVKYGEIEKQLASRKSDLYSAALGYRRFVTGLSKKMLIADTMAVLVDKAYSLEAVDAPTAWLAAVAYALQIYYDFSGYSDMAIGMGQMFGFVLPENFDDPYAAQSVTEFWRRWHMSLTGWFRSYVYIPLGGNRRGKARTLLNIFIVFVLTGVWHGAAYTFIVWGLYFAVLMVAERSGVLPVSRIRLRPIRHIYTILAVVFGFAVFRADSLSQGFGIIASCFGAGGAQTISLITPLITPYFICMFIFAVIGCLPARKKLAGVKGIEALRWAASVLLLAADILLLMTSSYSPFIYFSF